MSNHNVSNALQMFQTLLLWFMMWQVQEEFLLEELATSRMKKRIAFSPRDEDDDVLFLVALTFQYRRKEWTLTRSCHWITHVLTEDLLQGKEFERTFRMSRNSFERLHAILGNASCPWLFSEFELNRALHHITGHSFSQSNAFQSAPDGISLSRYAGRKLSDDFKSIRGRHL